MELYVLVHWQSSESGSEKDVMRRACGAEVDDRDL